MHITPPQFFVDVDTEELVLTGTPRLTFDAVTLNVLWKERWDWECMLKLKTAGCLRPLSELYQGPIDISRRGYVNFGCDAKKFNEMCQRIQIRI